jgi:5-methyltetrahydropteroyltriglutamate--homocysteine methyltransferase
VGVKLKTTTAGWFPWSAELSRTRRDHREGEADDAALCEAEARALEDVLSLQEELGLDLHVDGQLDRSDMIAFFVERLEGGEEGGLVRVFGNRYYRRPVITGALSRPEPVTVDFWSRARDAAKRPVKAVLTGPYSLMHGSADEHYGSRADCCRALAEVVRAEVADLVAAGAEDVQLDEPAFGARPAEVDLAASAIARAFEPATGRARSWVWLGYADLRPVLREAWALPVDGMLLELASSGLDAGLPFDRFPQDKLLAAGVVDVLDARVEPADVLARRVERLRRLVPDDRLWLAPDAGLRTLTPDAASAKLRALVAAAG